MLFGLYFVSGLGMAGIGMGVMHDAIHGSYASSKIINKFLGYTLNIIGANDKVWKLQHNVLHHSFTNIEEHDDDINPPFFLRFSPHAKLKKIHKYQHYYAWFFYGISTISWVISADFVRFTRYYNMGLVKNKTTYIEGILKIVFWKIVYFFLILILPILSTSLSPVWVLLAFLAMHFITGLCITLVFQCAHVTPSASFPLPNEEGQLESDHLAHQLKTTSNFGTKSPLLSWMVGGLTNQIEHHLFPNISHVHYRKIAPIVRQTALEYGLPYYNNGSFGSAIMKHFKMLKDLGQMQLEPISK